MLQLDAAGVLPFFISTSPALIEYFVDVLSAQLHNGRLNHVHRYIIEDKQNTYWSFRAERYLHETIPYMVNHLTDLCKYLHFSGVTDMFGLRFYCKLENLIVPPSDQVKIH